MNQNPGIIGIKIGMTQVFDDKGEVIRCTVVQGGCVVIGKRTIEKDGYSALILGLGERKEKHTTKPVAGASCKGSVDLECPYPGNDYCVCSGTSNDAHWVCQANPPTCAASKPLVESCNTVRTCSWGTNKEQACFCNGSRWGCEGGF